MKVGRTLGYTRGLLHGVRDNNNRILLAQFIDQVFNDGRRNRVQGGTLKLSLDALVKLDYDQAFNVVMMDDEVDAIKEQAYDRIKKAIRNHPDKIGYLINLLLISRHLERLADHATNIAEEVIYLIEGEIVRHAKHDQD